MPDLIIAFTVLSALAFLAYRAAFGPQASLARLALGCALAALVPLRLAYPDEQSAWLYATYTLLGSAVGLLALMLVTGARWALRRPAGPQSPRS